MILIFTIIYHRWLHATDPLRGGPGDGVPEGPPPPRTHEQACREAKWSENSTYGWDNKNNHPRIKTGINYWCPLSVLMKFNMIWDFCPDMMHIISTFFERLVIGVFSGARRKPFTYPQPVDPGRGKNVSQERHAEYKVKHKLYTKKKKENDKLNTNQDKCTFSKADMALVDMRVKNLCGEPDWIKNSLVRVIHNRILS
jgi:hypothetical protein